MVSLCLLAVTRCSAEKSKEVIMENLIAGLIAAALCVYLFYAMIRPEKF